MTETELLSKEYELYRDAQFYFNANNLEACMKLLLKLSLEGYSPANAFIGYLYLTGAGVDCDRVKAYQYFQKAADEKHYYGIAFLTRMKFQETHFPTNIGYALKGIVLAIRVFFAKLSSSSENKMKLLFRIEDAARPR